MSAVFKLDAIDWKKIGKGLLIASGGAGLTYLGQAIAGIDFGQATPAVVGALSFGINFLLKLLTNTTGA